MSVKRAIMMAKIENPVEFSSAIRDELMSRMTTALDTKKIEIAQNIFSQGDDSND